MLRLAVGCLAVAVLAWGNATQDVEKEKTDAQKATEAEGKKSTLSGVFTLLRESVGDGNPLPKVIGFVTQQNFPYQVIVTEQALLDQLVALDKKPVRLSGKLVDGGDKGKFLIAEGMIDADAPPPSRRKRGGL
jgi:hypothetical protein